MANLQSTVVVRCKVWIVGLLRSTAATTWNKNLKEVNAVCLFLCLLSSLLFSDGTRRQTFVLSLRPRRLLFIAWSNEYGLRSCNTWNTQWLLQRTALYSRMDILLCYFHYYNGHPAWQLWTLYFAAVVSIFFRFSSPILSGRRLDAYIGPILPQEVNLVRI